VRCVRRVECARIIRGGIGTVSAHQMGEGSDMSMFGTVRRDWDWSRRPLGAQGLRGRTIAVVGGTGGIGRAIVNEAVSKGAEAWVVGRTFRDRPDPRVHFVQADLSSLRRARAVVAELPVPTFDVVVMTQGIFAGRQRKVNEDGIELDMAISHLSRSVMAREMAPTIGSGRPDGALAPRIFVMGFPGGTRAAEVENFNAERPYVWEQAHANTVVGNEALVLDGAERYPHVRFYGLNPGIMKSNIMGGLLGEGSPFHVAQQTVIGLIFQSVEQYAAKIVPLLFAPEIDGRSGAMFDRNANPIFSNPYLTDRAYRTRVTEASEALLARVR
jgi:NAD(P)-dependent dehydrogenase (short-subunit alcohol dehydrogenase family)